MSAARDGLALAIGTLTRIPVPPPRQVDRQVARIAMSIAPLAGLVLAVLVGVPTAALAWAIDAPGHPLASLLVSLLAIAGIAWLTRGLHLDGLADLADALGSNKPADQALAIARRPDIGPFGTMAILLALLIQGAALGLAIDAGLGALILVVALVASRLSLTWACTPSWPPARSDGLGAMVAQSTAVPVALATTTALAVAGGAVGWLLIGSILGALALPAGILSGLLAGWATLRVARRRLGGITGDVLGACVEVSCATALVTMAVLTSLR